MSASSCAFDGNRHARSKRPTTPTETGEIDAPPWNVVAALRRPNAWIPRQLPQGSRDRRQSGPRTANRTCRFRPNGAYGTLRTRGVVGPAKANPNVRKRGARAEGHRQVETCKHHGPNRRDCRHRDPRSTQTHNLKRAANLPRTPKGARSRHVECGAFDGAKP